jgi:hypothetical protein
MHIAALLTNLLPPVLNVGLKCYSVAVCVRLMLDTHGELQTDMDRDMDRDPNDLTFVNWRNSIRLPSGDGGCVHLGEEGVRVHYCIYAPVYINEELYFLR